jgi:hypothetical protein
MVELSTTPPSERYPGRPPEGRVVVIAPTRAACETIELGVQLTHVTTLIEQEHGEEIRTLAREGKGFGIMAGTGTGKTLAVRPIAQSIVGQALRVGVVNREREATPETPTWNLVIVTTGIARLWLQDNLITADDVVVVDEIHQTSAELELCLALAKRAGCRFIWLSATVDPRFYSEYLQSAEVIESSAFDPDAGGGGARVQHPQPHRLPGRPLHAPRHQAEAGRGRVRPHPRGDRGRRQGGAGEVAQRAHRVLPRRRAGGQAAAVPGGRGRAAPVHPVDDGGGPERAQHPWPGHGGDRGRAVRLAGAARPQRADAPSAGVQRDPADGRARARPGGERRGVDPLRAADRLRILKAHGAQLPAGGRPRARGADLRGHGRASGRSRPPGSAGPHRLPPRGGDAGVARADRERPAHALRAAGGDHAGGPRLGRAAGEGRRAPGAAGGHHGVHRFAAPHAAPAGQRHRPVRGAGKRPPDRVPHLRGRAARAGYHGERVRPAAPRVRRAGPRRLVRGARRAGAVHRGRRARHRLHLPRARPGAAALAAEAERQPGGATGRRWWRRRCRSRW